VKTGAAAVKIRSAPEAWILLEPTLLVARIASQLGVAVDPHIAPVCALTLSTACVGRRGAAALESIYLQAEGVLLHVFDNRSRVGG